MRRCGPCFAAARPTASSAPTSTSKSPCSPLTGAVIARGKHDAPPAEPYFVTRVVDEVLRGIAVPPPLASGPPESAVSPSS